MSTAAPTSTKRITSAAIHSFPNFSERRFDTPGTHLIRITAAMLTTASRPETDIFPFNHVSTDIKKNDIPRIKITFILLRTYCSFA
jgi:hypothetical protein